jgi:hypothetical protein
MDDAIAVALERQTERVLGFRMLASSRVPIAHGIAGKQSILDRFEFFARQHPAVRISEGRQDFVRHRRMPIPSVAAAPMLEI